MSRFFIDSNSIQNDKVIITGENHNHLCYVLRAKKGDRVVLCDGTGTDYLAVIENIDKMSAHLTIEEKNKNKTEPSIDVTLFFATLKGDKNDLVVQKAVELGAKQLCPFISKFVQVKSEQIRTDRLNKISLEAAKQCNRGVVPIINPTLKLSEVAKKLKEFDFVIFPCEHEKVQDIKTCLKSVLSFSKTAIVIGAEGGFDLDEMQLLINSGAKSVTLGNRILRAETASISALSILMYEAGQMKV